MGLLLLQPAQAFVLDVAIFHRATSAGDWLGLLGYSAGHAALRRKEFVMHELARLIRAVPNFPQAGVMFRDVTPLLADAQGFAESIKALAAPWRGAGVMAVCGIEARGFIFGAALAQALDAGFVPLRKPGKLPPPVLSVDYQLEYGSDRLQVRRDALAPGMRVLLVDDVLATGGTLAAARQLIEAAGASLLGAAVLIELDTLQGRARWANALPLHAVLHY